MPLDKGRTIANCGELGIDWRTSTMSDYFEALEAKIEMTDPKAANKPTATPGGAEMLKRAMAAIG